MKRFRIHAFFVLILLTMACPAAALAACPEPAMSTYASTPVFVTQSVKPNVMIILDNSGSMNFAAYGTWQGDGLKITDSSYTGSTPYCGTVDVRVIQGKDDAEERASTGFTTDTGDAELDLGIADEDDRNYIVGLRFQNINIPQGATISGASIVFTAQASNNSACTLSIRGQLDDDTSQFSATTDNIKNRANTSTTSWVTWDNSSGMTNWVSENSYSTPDLRGIVQEVVNRSGWHPSNSIVFKIRGGNTGLREAYSYDGSASKAPLLHVEYTPAIPTRYYGYFDPDSQYSYSNQVFSTDPNGQWNGNFLNWLSMRRIDVAKKVIMGGKATSRTGGGGQALQDLVGDDHQTQPDRWWWREFDTSQSGVSLTAYNGNYKYRIRDGYITVDADKDGFDNQDPKFTIKVEKDPNTEPEAFASDNTLAGVLQKVGMEQARWGLTFYNYSEGGKVHHDIGNSNITSMITTIASQKADTWTPLAETFYEVARYFRQDSPYYHPGNFQTTESKDPYHWDDGYVHCAKSFVIFLTDGESTYDQNIPSSLRNYAAGYKTSPSPTFPDNGTDYLPDVALWARTTDLRSDLQDEQNLYLYVVYAFGKGSQLLQDAAKNGGFEDKNGDDRPNTTSEWDEDEDGFPDTYYESEDGYQLESELIRAINDILERAASGTAVSVLATSGEGEGNLVQAYFRPSVRSGDTDVKWLGYLQSLWVDSHGNLREDTINDRFLDVTQDRIVEYFVGSSGEAKIRRYAVSGTSPYPAYTSGNMVDEVALEEITPLFEAGARLHTRSADDRRIFTFIDKDKDGVVDEPTSDYDIDDDDGEMVRFHYGTTTAVGNVKPYLGVRDYTTWKYLGDQHNDRAGNLIKYIRGMEPGYSGSASFTGTTTMQVRTRVLDGNVWKLGDIINSTPVTVSKPVDNYHIIYRDESYQRYYNYAKNRETVVYVGANDGMLHAFTSWQYSGVSSMYVKPSAAPSGEQIGDELWAYIPQTLLPHLKWIPHKDYSHVYYVDLKPKVFDAKILPDNTHYTDANDETDGYYDNWGTFLLGGLNFGGMPICSEDTFASASGVTTYETRNFNPVYFLMDITDPREPKLMWEREFIGLNMSQSVPAVIKVNNEWLGVFGSGPTDFDGNSTTKGRVYVVDLKTGDSYRNTANFASGTTNAWLFETAENNSFINSPISFDKDLDYHVDAVYLGTTYEEGSTWKGKAYKIAIQTDWEEVNPQTELPPLSYTDSGNPNGSHPWKFVSLFNATRPITAPLSLSIDHDQNVWVYFGTGRYISDEDKTSTDSQYLFGVKDPFFDSYYTAEHGGYYHSYDTSLQLTMSNLFNATNYVVKTDGNVYNGTTLVDTWEEFLKDVRADYSGWYRELETEKERALSKFTVLGGIVFAPTYVPTSDICGYGGDSYLYGMYYETGTAYYNPVFNPGVDQDEILVKVYLGAGKSSAAGIHVGQESGAKAFIQQSTGIITQQQLTPAFNIKSGLINWRQN